MDEGEKLHFSLVVKREALFRFRQLVDLQTQLKFWTKGDSERFLCLVSKFDESSLEWETTLERVKDLPEKVYFHFKLGGSEYFGRAYTFRSMDNLYWRFRIADNLYKAEKREHQRLLVFPHLLVDFELPNPIVEGKEAGSLISFGRRNAGTQTDLMLKFNQLIGKSNTHESYSLKMRVLDISMGGLSFKVGKDTKDFFPPGSQFNGCKLHFEKDMYHLLTSQVMYRRHVKDDLFVAPDYYRIGIVYKISTEIERQRLKVKIDHWFNKGDATSEFQIFRSHR